MSTEEPPPEGAPDHQVVPDHKHGSPPPPQQQQQQVGGVSPQQQQPASYGAPPQQQQPRQLQPGQQQPVYTAGANVAGNLNVPYYQAPPPTPTSWTSGICDCFVVPSCCGVYWGHLVQHQLRVRDSLKAALDSM